MLQYRITKYDPKYRDDRGAYMRDEWTAVSDIGKTFNGVELTPAAYFEIEDAYVKSAVAFLSESDVTSLFIDSLENYRDYYNSGLNLANGRECSLLNVAEIVRLNLRSNIWCRLVCDGSFLHVGQDYYMYIGVPKKCPRAIELATEACLFVEPFYSPLHHA
jgi:hypothetical protein